MATHTNRFEAFDGQVFPTAAARMAYERDNPVLILSGREPEEIEAAISRADLTLANAIEDIARRIKRARRSNGAPSAGADPDADAAKPEFPPGYDPQNYDERVA